ncbi:MAG: NADH:ubiquinone reductase (Na(+)-transporting) subunit C [Rhodobacteraceae bacterium]|jgi:Na+-transporting NADH:ubiquinone oxidoreductase subunit C|nr:NADH:ubiquinone reductase (Na(+)-transporting) subunit C [Paracoccaceae bacterium]
MAETPRRTPWGRFLALPNDSLAKTLGVAFLVALVSATTVSVTSIALKPRQQAHIDAAREAQLAELVATLPGLAEILRATGADTMESVLVDLTTGEIDTTTDPAGYDFLAAQTDPALSDALPPELDLARIGRLPRLAPVYLVRDGDDLALVVLQIYGAGYQSTIRAYLALEGDLNTIAGLSIYEQGETPGLGSRITAPEWQALWSGQQVADATGEIAISVVRGGAAGPHEVDGITGATRSSNGVAGMVQFWMGENGYGPFLDRLKSEGV